VVLGRFGRDYLRHNGPEHVLCFAPTRSGKGVGLVVPTLLTWPASAIVHDIKGENWEITAGLRARIGRVLLFDPTNQRSAAYNPLLEVRRGIWEVRDVQNVADVLVDPEGSLERRNHWEKTSHSLLVGAILHVLYQDALRVQAGVVQALDTSRTETNGLVASSQSAVGILQASQAGNQLIALQTRQLVDLTALVAAQSRAQSLEGARLTANQEQGRVQLNQFLNVSRGYQPQTVQMFHQ
jgi:type IV secretion system protein VirD4